MKSIKYVISLLLAIIFITACNEGIDPVNPLDPGPDTSAPIVTITSPPNGLEIKVKDDLATLDIKGEIRDDIELESVAVLLDGREITSFTNFTDYRRFILNYTYTQIANGAHTLTVTGKDKTGKSTSQSVNFVKVEAYKPIYDGEIFYMPFDVNFSDLISETEATKVGNPGLVQGKKGMAYSAKTSGTGGDYISFPAADFMKQEFSAVFWYKFTTVAPDNRAGILTLAPAPVAPATSGSRQFGFRFLREGGATNQKFNFNVGTGSGEGWADGGANATVDPTATDWIFMAITISTTELAVFIDGKEVVRNTSFGGISWTGCSTLSIMSGVPNFVEWNHFTDLSLMDELRIFNKALTQQEIQKIMNDN